MNTEIIGILVVLLVTILLAIPLGKYIAQVYTENHTWLDAVFGPLENFFFKISGIDASREMDWKAHLGTLLSTNLIWFLLGFFLLMNQGWLPLNPDHNPSMSIDLAFNTAISFLINCNL